MKVTYYVASSLDSFIARPDGDVSWLDDLDIPLQETGYEQFYASVDGVVMGRKTYEMIVSFGEWPYDDKPTWVCSSEAITPIAGCNLQTAATPEKVITQANKLNLNHLWMVGGGKVAASFIEAKLISHLSISQMPILLGDGIHLFDKMEHSYKLKHIQAKQMDAGFLQLDYQLSYTE